MRKNSSSKQRGHGFPRKKRKTKKSKRVKKRRSIVTTSLDFSVAQDANQNKLAEK